jgi:hypothetical protein
MTTRGLLLLPALLLAACATKPLAPPSSVAVDTGLQSTKMSVKEAQKHNDTAVIHNTKAMTAVERIDAKAAVLKKYWHKQ